MDTRETDQANIRRILLFLEEYDMLNANWETAEAFLGFLRRTVRLDFKLINRPYLQRLYDMYRDQQELKETA